MSIFSYSADIKHFLFTTITYIDKLQERLQVDTELWLLLIGFPIKNDASGTEFSRAHLSFLLPQEKYGLIEISSSFCIFYL